MLFGVQQFTGSYAPSTPVRPVSDVDISKIMIMGSPDGGKAVLAAQFISRLSRKLDSYYNKSIGSPAPDYADCGVAPTAASEAVIQALQRLRL